MPHLLKPLIPITLVVLITTIGPDSASAQTPPSQPPPGVAVGLGAAGYLAGGLPGGAAGPSLMIELGQGHSVTVDIEKPTFAFDTERGLYVLQYRHTIGSPEGGRGFLTLGGLGVWGGGTRLSSPFVPVVGLAAEHRKGPVRVTYSIAAAVVFPVFVRAGVSVALPLGGR